MQRFRVECNFGSKYFDDNGESSVKLNFALERRVTGITFDKEVIEF